MSIGRDCAERCSDRLADAPRQQHASKRSAGETIDMTPMVDVTFLLLIFFMVTASFSIQQSLQIPQTPRGKAGTIHEPASVTVVIDRFNTFRVQAGDLEQEAPSRHELIRSLRRARESAVDGNPKLLVMAHEEAFHEYTVTALDAGVEAGLDNITLLVANEDI